MYNFTLTLDEVKILLGEKDLLVHDLTKQLLQKQEELEELKKKYEPIKKEENGN